MPDRCLLYYISDRAALAADESTRRRRLLEKVAEASRAGIDYIQLREKDLSTRDLEILTREAVDIVQKLHAKNPELSTRILVNSRSDVALAAGADGVHLRSDDVSAREIRNIWSDVGPATPVIAVSCHSSERVAQAGRDGANFAVFAPVFEKKDAPETQPAGLAGLHAACEAGIPVLALGGISVENAKSCLQAGAAGIAAIRLFQENNIAEVARELRALEKLL